VNCSTKDVVLVIARAAASPKRINASHDASTRSVGNSLTKQNGSSSMLPPCSHHMLHGDGEQVISRGVPEE